MAVLVCCASVQGQTIKRMVIGSGGFSGSTPDGSTKVLSTTGQAPNAGTISSGAIFIRQGFQQPLLGGGAGESEPCAGLLIDFDITSEVTDCGEYFSFTYMGDDPTGYTIEWYFGEEGGPRYSNQRNPNGVGFISSGVKLVRLTVSTDSCSTSISKAIPVSDGAFLAQEEIIDISCTNATGSIDLSVFNGEQPINFSWSGGQQMSTLENLQPGSYTVDVVDNRGCVFKGQYEISKPPAPILLRANARDESCTDSGEGNGDASIEVQVENGTGDLTFQWGNGREGIFINNLVAGPYPVVVTDEEGCVAERTFVVSKTCDKRNIPDVITPNGDGQNEVWVIPGILDFPNNQVRIFNRWGSIVYNRQGYMNTWTGTNSDGSILPAAAYFYVIELNDPQQTVWSGAITIVR